MKTWIWITRSPFTQTSCIPWSTGTRHSISSRLTYTSVQTWTCFFCRWSYCTASSRRNQHISATFVRVHIIRFGFATSPCAILRVKWKSSWILSATLISWSFREKVGFTFSMRVPAIVVNIVRIKFIYAKHNAVCKFRITFTCLLLALVRCLLASKFLHHWIVINPIRLL